jgi:predicted GIY-YIG superfamily endonuclease
VYYTYIIRSINNPDNFYTGSTSDLQKRLLSHNEGANKHTTKYKPWRIVWYCAFSTKKQAIDFEIYLKTASGIAFKRKRLL